MMLLINKNGDELKLIKAAWIADLTLLISDDTPEIHELLETQGLAIAWGEELEYETESESHEIIDVSPALLPGQIIVQFK